MPFYHFFKGLAKQFDIIWSIEDIYSFVRNYGKEIGSTFQPCSAVSHFKFLELIYKAKAKVPGRDA